MSVRAIAQSGRLGANRDRTNMDGRTTKYIFVTGGVVSSLGKGIAAASLAAILESRSKLH